MLIRGGSYPRRRVCEYAPLREAHRRDPVRRARHAAAGALPGVPQAAGRGRRPADRLARDQHVPGARVPPVPAADRIPGRAGRTSSPLRSALAGGGRGPLPRYRRRHAHRRAAAPGRVGARVEERFCLAYADGVADIDLGALLDYHRGHGQRRDDGRGPARACRSGWRGSTATDRCADSPRSHAASTG